jgi:hypothetical protein
MNLNWLLVFKPTAFSLVTIASLLSLFTITVKAQQPVSNSDEEFAYRNAIRQRAEKIVATLDINDGQKASRVTTIIADQYSKLNDIYNDRDKKIKGIKQRSNDQPQASLVNKVQEDVSLRLQQRHQEYLKNLAKELNPKQIDQVKDGMTYGVVNITYKGYQDMLPQLTEEQKKQILAWLIEAREHAMDAESSEKKHAWFGKYKGRINNYLSAAGYDLKKAGDEWQARIKAEKAAKKSE